MIPPSPDEIETLLAEAEKKFAGFKHRTKPLGIVEHERLGVWAIETLANILPHVRAQQSALRGAADVLAMPCTGCERTQRDAAASGQWIYTEACGKCQACSKALIALQPFLPKP